MTTPAWLKAAADPVEAAAQLHSRLLVAREIGPVYGHGALPDWVKAAQTPPPTDVGQQAAGVADAVPTLPEAAGGAAKGVSDAAGVVHPPVKSLLDRAEGTVRPPLEKLVQKSTLGKNIPDSKSTPGDPLGALGSSIRPAMIGTGIGAGVGLLGGLTGKKKRPLSGMLLGGLAGGLTGGAGGYLYDRFAGQSTPDKPNPTDIQGASDKIDAQAPGAVNEFRAGLGSQETWSPPQLQSLADKMKDSLVPGAAVGAAVGAGVGGTSQGLYNAATKGSRTTPTTGTIDETPIKTDAKGRVTVVPNATGTRKTQNLKATAPPTTSAIGRGFQGGIGGAVTGAAGNAALKFVGHVGDHGVQELNSSNPAVVAEGFQKLTAYSPDLLASSPPAVKLEQQKLLAEATARQATLKTMAQTGQPLTAVDRQINKELKDRLDAAGLIQIQPVGQQRR